MKEVKPKEKKRAGLKEDKIEGSEKDAVPEGKGKKEVPLEDMSKAELLDEIKKTLKSVDENYDLHLRSQAEIDNLKKRFQKEKTELIKFSNESLIKQLLPVLDNLENAVSHSGDESTLDALKEGVKLTLKGFRDTLEKSGLEVLKAEGEPFDPNFHQAITEQEDKTLEPGRVLKELQKGYMLNERLIRPAMVIVSKERGKK
ncbi:MAG: nucleotide exchange factor GrpE [Desulfobacterales bacterium]|nr:nucleotide exchange factor GrpE [Desulfobacterales bacterium]